MFYFILLVIANLKSFFLLDLTICNMWAALPWQLSFQVAATPIMEGIVEFHNSTMLFLIFTGSLVC
jgi:hypothetical protein